MRHTWIPLLTLIFVAGCVAKPAPRPAAKDLREVDVGLVDGYRATVVADGLMNPSFVAFHPGDGALTICDSGNGRIVMVEGDTLKTIVEGMHTEYWKTLEDGTKAFKLGPLTMAWRDTDHLMVTDAGVGDGEFLRRVGDDELHGEAIGLALQAAVLDQAADAEGLALRRLPCGDLRRREEKHQVALEGVEHQRGGDAEYGKCPADEGEAFMAWFHLGSLGWREARA